MTPSRHKEEPVWNFLCEDSCVCGHAGETVEVRQCDSEGVPLLLLCSTLFFFSYTLCSILSLVFRQLRLLPCCPASPPSVWPLYSRLPHHRPELLGLNTQRKATMPQLALAARVDHSISPLRVGSHVVTSIVTCGGGHLWYFSQFSQHLQDARAYRTGFPHLRVHIDPFTNQFI